MTVAVVYPGSFDPVTNGHLDVIERAAEGFDRVVVAVLRNVSKRPLFTLDERLDLLRDATAALPGVEVIAFEGLLVDVCRDLGVGLIVKGLRAAADFEYELRMAQMNRHLAGVDTLFLPTSPAWSYLSSSLVKEVARFGGDVADLVPPAVAALLRERTT
jgi:pantetheine-phosphate adenylyltransferase